MGGLSQGEPQNVRSAEWRRTGGIWRSMEGDSGSDNGPKISIKKNIIIIVKLLLVTNFFSKYKLQI